MKTIGLIGGMSWYSTLDYYRILNEETQRRLGGHASAPISLQSLDFAVVRRLQQTGDWDGAAVVLSEAARACERAGADLICLCTNAMHKVAPQVQNAVSIPLVHVADAVAPTAVQQQWSRVGLIGTRYVMEEPFYADHLTGHGVSTVVPDEGQRELIDTVIFDELTVGVVNEDSRSRYAEIVDDLGRRGAQAVVLACTEVQLLLRPADVGLPLIDSTRAHALRVLDLAIGADRVLV